MRKFLPPQIQNGSMTDVCEVASGRKSLYRKTRVAICDHFVWRKTNIQYQHKYSVPTVNHGDWIVDDFDSLHLFEIKSLAKTSHPTGQWS